MRLKIEQNHVTGVLDVTLYERREDGRIVVQDPVPLIEGDEGEVDVHLGAEPPISFRTTEQRLAEVLLNCAKEIAL